MTNIISASAITGALAVAPFGAAAGLTISLFTTIGSPYPPPSFTYAIWISGAVLGGLAAVPVGAAIGCAAGLVERVVFGPRIAGIDQNASVLGRVKQCFTLFLKMIAVGTFSVVPFGICIGRDVTILLPWGALAGGVVGAILVGKELVSPHFAHT